MARKRRRDPLPTRFRRGLARGRRCQAHAGQEWSRCGSRRGIVQGSTCWMSSRQLMSGSWTNASSMAMTESLLRRRTPMAATHVERKDPSTPDTCRPEACGVGGVDAPALDPSHSPSPSHTARTSMAATSMRVSRNGIFSGNLSRCTATCAGGRSGGCSRREGQGRRGGAPENVSGHRHDGQAAGVVGAPAEPVLGGPRRQPEHPANVVALCERERVLEGLELVHEREQVVVGRQAQHQPVLGVERHLAAVAVCLDESVERVALGHPGDETRVWGEGNHRVALHRARGSGVGARVGAGGRTQRAGRTGREGLQRRGSGVPAPGTAPRLPVPGPHLYRKVSGVGLPVGCEQVVDEAKQLHHPLILPKVLVALEQEELRRPVVRHDGELARPLLGAQH
eukprot:scaffold2685_cov101-Isochrysis_galbana.AAC.6